MAWTPAAADWARRSRSTVAADNPFLLAERLWADGVIQAFDLWRDMGDAFYVVSFLFIYGSPFMHWVGRFHDFQRIHKEPGELRFLPEAQAALMNLERGG